MYEISYKTFVKEPLNNLKKIYDSLGIKGFTKAQPYFQKYIDFHKNYKKDKYVLSEIDKDKVLKNWEFTFDAFGYSR